MAFGLGVPSGWVLATVANEASHLVLLLQESASRAARAAGVDRLARLAARADRAAARRPGCSIPTPCAIWSRSNLSQVSSQLLSVAGGLARNVIQLAITLMALFVLYLDGERVLVQARRLAGIFFPAAPVDFVDDIGAVVRAVVFGLLGTAVAQGAIAAIGFVIFGVPSPVLLGMVTALASFVPFGPTLVWMAAVLGLVLAGRRAPRSGWRSGARCW